MDIYVLEMIAGIEDGSSVSSVVGVYSTLELAEAQKRKIENCLTKEDAARTLVECRLLTLDDDSTFIRVYETTLNKLQDMIDRNLETLMKKDYVEQLVGEDGRFYYQLTENGQKLLDTFKKKKEDP